MDLSATRITDDGIKELKDFKNITTLNLFRTQITDAAMAELKEMKNL